jgi:hypothetical protein
MDALKPKYSLTGTIFMLIIGVAWIGFQPWINAIQLAVFLGALAAFGLAGALFVDYFIGRRSEDRRAEMYADGNSPVNVINALARLTPEMQHNLTAARAVIEAVPNLDGPRRTIRLPGESAPFPEIVILAVWDLVTEQGMPAVRTFGDETQLRRCATAMTSWFVGCGWCRPASGNQSAQWTTNGYELARKAMGLGKAA